MEAISTRFAVHSPELSPIHSLSLCKVALDVLKDMVKECKDEAERAEPAIELEEVWAWNEELQEYEHPKPVQGVEDEHL